MKFNKQLIIHNILPPNEQLFITIQSTISWLINLQRIY